MSRGDASHGSIADEDSAQPGEPSESDGGASGLRSRIGTHAKSGTLAGVLGGAAVLRGVRSLRAGERARGLGRLVVGGALLAVAAAQRRARRGPDGEPIDIDQSDVVDTAPDIGDVGSSSDEGDRAGGDAASEVVDTGPDIEDAADGDRAGVDTGEGNGTGVGGGAAGGTADGADTEAPEDSEGGGDTEPADAGATDTGAGGTADAGTGEEATETAADAGPDEAVTYDRLGEAAYDEHSNEVPVPQQAFNRGFLSLGEEAHWGVRDDGSVVVSERFDPVQGGDGVDYVATTTVDDDRVLTVPDEVTDHWDDAAGGPMAVESGDGVVFATSDDLATDRQLLVVPAAWAEDVLGESV
ncbi:hypothetical protein [Halosimplex halobium]|uniref:hypothetical protein n=1 Tax=Halosimplex halobium TaxID=3396618 RepID=UPI003F5648DC